MLELISKEILVESVNGMNERKEIKSTEPKSDNCFRSRCNIACSKGI